MTLQEAILLARKGIKMTHIYFTANEWLIMHGNIIKFEDGAEIWLNEWMNNKTYLDEGWSIYPGQEKTFYRICNIETYQGLWYDQQGNFTGNIHNQFNFCTNSNLRMDFDIDIRGYLSATSDLDELYHWFPKEDILKLQKNNYYIFKYKTEDYKFYERFNHWIINQKNSTIVSKIVL